MYPISSQDESWFPGFDTRGEPTFHKHLKRSFPSTVGIREGPCVFCFKWNGPREPLTQKKAWFPYNGLNSVSSFISQDKGMSESSVQSLRKTQFPASSGQGASHTLTPREAHGVSKGAEARLFLKIDRNPNISVETRKGCLDSDLTSRSVCIILPNLV